MTDIEVVINARDVRLASGLTLKVRGLAWGDAFRVLKRAGESAKELFLFSESGEVKVDLTRLPELILESSGMVECLLHGATGMSGEEIASLPIEDVLTLVNVALEMTLTEGLIKNATALGERLSGLFQQAKKSPETSTTSSPRGTRPKQYPGIRSPS